MESQDQSAQQYLTFHIADAAYGVPIRRVREIIPYEPLTRVPTTPDWIRGVLSLRGGVVPVVDLAVKFGLGERPIGQSTCVVIVDIAVDDRAALMGVLTDSVDEVVDLPPDQIEAVPAMPAHARIGAVQGMGRVGSKLALLLDLDQALLGDAPQPERAPKAAAAVRGASGSDTTQSEATRPSNPRRPARGRRGRRATAEDSKPDG
jgi:purine-binding chemotaxis protein CheW